MTGSKLNLKDFAPLHPNLSSSGYQIHINSNALSFLNEAVQDNYASLKLIKKILTMRSNPRPWDGGIKTGKTDHRQLAIDGIWVNYFIKNGCVYIDEIKSNRNAKAKHELAGLHRVELVQGSWQITESYIKKIETQYAAVNGQNNDRGVAATTIMPNQLLNAYNKEKITKFTLFHNPTVSVFSDTYESARDKLGFTNPMTKSFSKILNESQKKKNKEIKWVTHSQGGAIFTEAVRYHSKKNGSGLNKHTVFFQASANNMLATKRIMKKAQVNLHREGYNNNPIDGVPQIIGMNSITDLIVNPSLTSVARLAISPFALIPGLLPLSFTSPAFSPHSTPYEGMGNYGKKVASNSAHSVKKMINRIV